jgi:hypothetical protein
MVEGGINTVNWPSRLGEFQISDRHFSILAVLEPEKGCAGEVQHQL